jgi:hypothetical protein
MFGPDDASAISPAFEEWIRDRVHCGNHGARCCGDVDGSDVNSDSRGGLLLVIRSNLRRQHAVRRGEHPIGRDQRPGAEGATDLDRDHARKRARSGRRATNDRRAWRPDRDLRGQDDENENSHRVSLSKPEANAAHQDSRASDVVLPTVVAVEPPTASFSR